MATDYDDDVRKYAGTFDEKAVAGVVRHCGIALRSRDAATVACSDAGELERVREKFLKKKLARSESDADLDAAIKEVCEKMKGDNRKSRVTFYYLLAEKYGQLDLFN